MEDCGAGGGQSRSPARRRRPTAKVGDIAIDQAWARASLGNAPNSAAYMILQNTGALPDRLIGGSTPVATRSSYTHVMEGGVAKMRPAAIEVAPGQPTEPGRAHVMLQGLTQKLEEGTTMPLTLVFEHRRGRSRCRSKASWPGGDPAMTTRWITASTGAIEGRSPGDWMRGPIPIGTMRSIRAGLP